MPGIPKVGENHLVEETEGNSKALGACAGLGSLPQEGPPWQLSSLSPLEAQQSERADCLSPHFTEWKTEVQKEEAAWEELVNGWRDQAWDSALRVLLWCFLDSLLGPARPQA